MELKKVKVLIIEDHPAMGYGTKMILEQMEVLDIIGIAETGNLGLDMVRKHRPDIVFLDLNLPDLHGREVAKRIKEQFPSIHIVIFTGYDTEPFFNQLMDIGISGIMMKSVSPGKVIRLVESILNGETVVPLPLYSRLRIQQSDEQSSRLTASLTDNERKIMQMVSRGFTNLQISKEIYMSTRSVENYLSKIYEKLGVKSRTEAVEKFAREMSELPG